MGLLIYKKEDADRNTFFIEELLKNLALQGLECCLKVYEDLEDKDIVSANFIINRSREERISSLAQEHGILVFNNSLVTRLGNDKELCAKYMENLGIPVLKTWDKTPQDYPYIEKSVDGHGGSEVFLVSNVWERNEAERALLGRKVIYQEVASNLGRDKRIYCLGDKILACVLRSNETDFKSNFSLGGKASLCDITEEEKNIVNKILNEIKPDYVGIDFIYHENRPYLNELEDMVGARMLYQLTDIDVAKVYSQYICTIYSKKILDR